MAIARWSPSQELTNLHTTMDRLFGDWFQNPDVGTTSLTFRLPVDVSETDNAYVIRAPVPGFRPEDVEVTVAGSILSISAHRQEQAEEREGNYIRREMIMGDFERQIALPDDAKPDSVNATFENGVLRVEVPRTPRPQPKKIEVKTEGQKQMASSSNQ